MKSNSRIIVLILALIAVIAGAAVLYSSLSDSVDLPGLSVQDPQSNAESSQSDSSQQLSLAPDFTVYDANGKAVKLSDMRGKPVVLNFWASWCSPCKSEMPDFQKAYEKYGEDIVFMMVNLTDGSQETKESASGFIADSGYTFPVYYDTDFSAAVAYAVYSIPVTFFIDADGYLVAYGQSALNLEYLEKGISMITGEQ